MVLKVKTTYTTQNVKKIRSITLIEILVSITLISVLYMFVMNNQSKIINKHNTNPISLDNLYQFLINFDYSHTISLKCIDDKDYSCFVFADGHKISKKFKLFDSLPTIYVNDSLATKKYFDNLEIDDISTEIVFDFTIDRYKKYQSFILSYKDKFYLYNPIYLYPKKYDLLSIITDENEEKSWKYLDDI